MKGMDNPADCALRDLFPSKLLQHSLEWNGPTWLKKSAADWPIQSSLPPNESSEEEKEISLHVISYQMSLLQLNSCSNFGRLKMWQLACMGISFFRELSQARYSEPTCLLSLSGRVTKSWMLLATIYSAITLWKRGSSTEKTLSTEFI